MINTKAIFKNATLIIIGSGFSAILEVVKNSYITTVYGINSFTDSFFLAISLPVVISSVIWRVCHLVLVPTFTTNCCVDKLNRNLATTIVLKLIIITIPLVFLLVLFSTTIVNILAPGIDSDTAILAGKMLKLAALIIIGAPIGGVAIAYLNGHSKYLFASFNNGIRNILIILLVIVFNANKSYLLPSFVIAFIIANIILYFPVYDKGSAVSSSLKNTNVNLVLKKMIFPFFSFLINDSISIIEQLFASFYFQGSISIVTICSWLPRGIAGMISSGITGASLADLSKQSAVNSKTTETDKLFSKAIIVSFIIGSFFVSFTGSITDILYGVDKDRILLIWKLMIVYGVLIYFSGMQGVLLSLMYSQGFTRDTSWHFIVLKVINIALIIVFSLFFDLFGLGLAAIISALFSVLNLYRLVKKRLNINVSKQMILFISKLLFVSCIFCISMLVLDKIFYYSNMYYKYFLFKYIYPVVKFLVGCLFYFLLTVFFKIIDHHGKILL